MALKTLSDDRHKLLDLYYKDKISEDFFDEVETRLATAIEAVRHEAVALSEGSGLRRTWKPASRRWRRS